jgi:hypothetical protein
MKRTVVIGASRRQYLPAKVCEWTVRARTSGPFDLIHTYDREVGTSDILRKMNVSGFSFVRFAVPELTIYEGRAIYLDSDMLIFRDLSDLFSMEMGDALVQRPKNQTAVLLYDCAKLVHWRVAEYLRRLEAGEYSYGEMMTTLCEPRVGERISAEWNCRDTFTRGRTAILHYTATARQPWVDAKHHLGFHWFDALRDAVMSGAITIEEVAEEVRLGHVGQWVLNDLLRRVH